MLAEAALALHRHSSRLSSTIRKHPSIVTITARPFFLLAPRQSPEEKLGKETVHSAPLPPGVNHAFGRTESSSKLVMTTKVQCRSATLRRLKRGSRISES